MNLAQVFNARFFVINALIVVGLIFSVFMIAREKVAAPRVIQNNIRPTSVLKRLIYTKKNRTRNVAALGLPPSLQKEVIRQIERHEKSFRHANPNPLISRGLKKNDIRTESAFKFCPQGPRRPDPAYAAAPLLLEITDLSVRPLTLNELATGIKVSFPGLVDEIGPIYANMEETNLGGMTDKPCISISYILNGKQDEILERLYRDENGRPNKPPTCDFLIANNDGLRKKLIEYFSNFQYIAELAQNETSGICD